VNLASLWMIACRWARVGAREPVVCWLQFKKKSIYRVVLHYLVIGPYKRICCMSKCWRLYTRYLISWTQHCASGHWSSGRDGDNHPTSWHFMFIWWLLVYVTYWSHMWLTIYCVLNTKGIDFPKNRYWLNIWVDKYNKICQEINKLWY